MIVLASFQVSGIPCKGEILLIRVSQRTVILPAVFKNTTQKSVHPVGALFLFFVCLLSFNYSYELIYLKCSSRWLTC